MITEHSKFMGHIEGSLGMEVHSNTGIPKKDRNISNKQPKGAPSRTGVTTIKKAQTK